MNLRSFPNLLLAAAASGLASLAQAGEPDFVMPPPASPDKWEFSIGPYAWLSGLDGSVGIGPAVADIDLSFSDIFDHLNYAIFLSLEARKGRWGVQVDTFYVSLSADGSTPGPNYGDANLDVDEFRIAPMLTYRVLEGSTNVDLLAGAQYFRMDTDLKLDAGLSPSVKGSDTEDWIDPMIGLRIEHQITEKWVALARADIGGFGVGSDFSWQAFGAIGYRWHPNAAILAGYRYLDIDYDSNGFTFDAATAGIMIGLQWTF
jgi:opacity protein-like surface antigen